MHPTILLFALLSAASTTLSAPLTPSKRATGSAHVQNNCPFPLTLQPVHGSISSAPITLPANGGTWVEPFQPTTSVKIWTSDPSKLAQFEYDLDTSTSKVFYDLSLINGNPFEGHYQALIPAQANCGPVECLANQHCDLAYNTPDENTATHGCPQSSDVTYFVCGGPRPGVVPDSSR